jgi:hypothetical protein
MHRFYNRLGSFGCVSEMNSCPKVSLLTISIILATRLSSNLSKISSNSKMGFTPLCFFKFKLSQSNQKRFLLSLRTKFWGDRRFQMRGRLCECPRWYSVRLCLYLCFPVIVPINYFRINDFRKLLEPFLAIR